MKKSHPILVGIESVKPYRLTTSDSLYDVRPPAMQIDQFLTVGGIMGMTSYPGVGKTWLAMEVARAVASGDPFLGRYRTTRGGILFVGSDSSLADYAQQWTRLTKHLKGDRKTYEPVRFLIQSEFMFEDRDEIRKLIRTHQKFEWGEIYTTDDGPRREQGFHVIIFDTLSKLTRANQNDNSEMEEVFRNIRWLAEATDAAIVLLHHNSKKSEFNDGSDWRGAMSQIGALDSWVQLSSHRKDKYLIGVEFKKFRGITPENFSYKMDVGEKGPAHITYSDVPVTRDQKQKSDALAQRIIEHVKEHPGVRAVEIKTALWPAFSEGVAPSEGGPADVYTTEKKLQRAIHNRLNTLVADERLIRDVNNEGKTIYRVKEVAPKPDEARAAKRKPRRSRRKS